MNLPINQIICGDCLEVMKDWPDNCVDLVLTDPPYGIGEAAGKNKSRGCLGVAKDYGDSDWDDDKLSNRHIWELLRTGRNLIVFGGNYYANTLPPSSCWIVWDKDNGATDFADCELVWTSFKTAVRLVKWKWQGMLQEPGHKKDYRQHPTQKPLGVMLWILKRYSKPTDLVVDPTCGSGTSCVAAKMLGRNYIGIDISEEYCEIARARLKAVDTGVPAKEAKAGQMALFSKE